MIQGLGSKILKERLYRGLYRGVKVSLLDMASLVKGLGLGYLFMVSGSAIPITHLPWASTGFNRAYRGYTRVYRDYVGWLGMMSGLIIIIWGFIRII